MPAALHPPSPRPLNPTQIALLKALCQHGSTRETELATSLASHRLPAYRDHRGWALNSWTMEIRLQAELLGVSSFSVQ